ncbi:MAG: DUF1326 domain-containing protein [Rhizobiales bacterium]|nr:DUF1326 domain-containing protein [Hyphomicrobiales bacterium]MBI3673666.1 DUF1326 domain-containing protein [Hyphomicrobiales bacterium]
MAMTEWMLRGPEIATCNCAYGCPCQFNSPPTDGTCRATVGIHIEKGHYGKVKLDGLTIAATAAWPGPIHMGHGEILPIVDERATAEQREALLKIMSGQDTEPGATFFQVFVSMCEKVHEPVFKPIDFKADLKTLVGHFSVPGIVEAQTEPIKNPVTGKSHFATVSLPAGFEYSEAQFASGSSKSPGPIKLNNSGKHAHLAMLHITGRGVVH